MRAPLALLMSTALVLVACGGSDDGDGAKGADPATETRGVTASTGADEGELIVSAAASLTGAFNDIGDAFRSANPGASITFNFGPSDSLAGQIDEGAPVDVFASASPIWMDSVEYEGPGVTGRADFARNRLAIIVPVGNPAGIGGIEDLTGDGVKLVIAAEGVPAGDYARQIFENAGVSGAVLANVVSNEEDVKAVIAKVLSGDADAGIAYVTDLTPDVADRIALIDIPDEVNVIATYPIAVVNGSKEADLAQRFVDYVLGDGQQTLAGYGFLPPA